MTKDVFDTPPMGFSRRGKRGWVKVDKTPQAILAIRASKENKELKNRLAELEAIVGEIIANR